MYHSLLQPKMKVDPSKQHTCTISLMNFKPPGPISEPARRYPTITYMYKKK
jgi:hypothetical protein